MLATDSAFRRPLLAIVVAAALAAGCSFQNAGVKPAAEQPTVEGQEPAAADEDDDDAPTRSQPQAQAPRIENLPRLELTPQILYQLLVAEIAGQRGNMALSTRAYLDLARSTRDPRIARRAVEIAMFSRQTDAALEAARLWNEIDPGSAQARQMLAGVLVGSDRLDEAQEHVARLLEQEGEGLPGALLRLNRLFARQADKAQVQRIVGKLTEPYLKHAEAHYARGEAALNAIDNATAVAEAEQALSLRPNWEQAVLMKAQGQRAASPEKSVETLRTFLSKNPRSREVRLQLARALVNDKQYSEAREEFRKLLTDFPGNADVVYAVGVLSMQLSDYDAADANFRKLLEIGYREPNLARLYLGQIAEERKRPDEALDWFAAVETGEQYVAAQTRIGHILAQQGKIDEARQSLQAAAANSSRDRVQFLLAEAQILRDAGRAQEAYDMLDKSLVSQPDHPDLLYETALIAERLDRMDVMETHLRKLIALKPDNAHAYNALGYSLADRGQRLDEAQALVGKALEIAPDDPFILDSMGWVLYRKGDLQGALAPLQRAYGMRPDPEIAAHLGEVLWSLGKRDDAQKLWRDAARANPQNEVLANAIKKFIP